MRFYPLFFSPLASRGEGGGAAPAALTRTVTRNGPADFGRDPRYNVSFDGSGQLQINEGTNISRPIPLLGGGAVTLDFARPAEVYGFTYDAAGVGLGAIRPAANLGTLLTTYTFTAPANARSLAIYTKVSGNNEASTVVVTGFDPAATQTRTFQFPITPDNFTGTDSQRMSAVMDLCAFLGGGEVIVDRDLLLSEAVLVPSNTTLRLQNAVLKLAYGARDNIIRSANVNAAGVVDPAGCDNIRLIATGRGGVWGSDESWGSDTPVINGVSGNGTQGWRSIGVLLANVSGFVVQGLTVRDTNSWGICLEQCEYGLVNDITFNQTHLHLNQDGLDLRRGTRHVTVQNLRGGTYDDLLALTNLLSYDYVNCLSGGALYRGRTTFDIHNIVVRNLNRRFTALRAAGGFPAPHYWGGILLLCEDGLKIHDVSIDGVTGPQQIYVQFDPTAYGFSYFLNTQNTVDDMYNISISNTGAAPIYFQRPVKDITLTNVARTDETGAWPAAVPKAGSLRISRKYHDGPVEYMATV